VGKNKQRNRTKNISNSMRNEIPQLYLKIPQQYEAIRMISQHRPDRVAGCEEIQQVQIVTDMVPCCNQQLSGMINTWMIVTHTLDTLITERLVCCMYYAL
jgi:hypothetical protein